MNQGKILLIDDDIDLCHSVKNLLIQHGFNVHVQHNSKDLDDLIKNHQFDLVLLDILLPGDKDGIAICKSIRQMSSIPVIMLTGVNEDIEKILSLEVGADNYIIKPFNSRVLLAYINASLRRKSVSTPLASSEQEFVDVEYQVYEFKGWKLNTTSQILLSPKNQLVKLTSAEFNLLAAFLQRPQCVLSRNQLLDIVDLNSESFDRSIDIMVSRLRAKLDKEEKNSNLINTIRNTGYSFSCNVTKLKMSNQEWQNLFLETT